MDNLDQQIDQRVGESSTAQIGEGGKRREPDRLGMAAQFVSSLDSDPLPISLQLMGRV
jgi:hypothetical protein